MESVWILGAGALVGSALAYPVWTYFNDGAAMASRASSILRS